MELMVSDCVRVESSHVFEWYGVNIGVWVTPTFVLSKRPTWSIESPFLKYWNSTLLRSEKSSTIYRDVAYVEQISMSKHFEIQGPVNTEDLFI